MALSKRNDPFAALAHPIRREILIQLRDGPDMTAGTIAGLFPGVSRAAVSRHLGVLRRSRMVRSRVRGRESHYRLNPESIAQIHSTWCVQFEAILEGSLERLKAVVEAPPPAGHAR